MPYFLPKKGFRDGTDMLTKKMNVIKCGAYEYIRNYSEFSV